jgi:hypothetical protein
MQYVQLVMRDVCTCSLKKREMNSKFPLKRGIEEDLKRFATHSWTFQASFEPSGS